MFEVNWLQTALDELTAAWLQSDAAARTMLTAASNAIDKQLSRDPYGQSESRPRGTRITFVSSLAVRYQIEPDGKSVNVLHIRMFGKRRKQ